MELPIADTFWFQEQRKFEVQNQIDKRLIKL